jgi:biotin operon repressor
MTSGFGRLLVDLRTADSERVAEILAGCRTIDVEAGEPYFRNSFPTGALLVVEEGFVIVRATPRGHTRSIITCEAGPGRLLLQPSPDEVLFGLGASRLTAIPRDAFDQLLAVPGTAQILLDHLAATLGQKQEAIANFAFARHIDRVRRKLLQLGRNYGRVDREGIRIDFPVSHTVLAEMIGSSRETVTRALDELQRTGFVGRQGRTYRLLVSPESVLDALPA